MRTIARCNTIDPVPTSAPSSTVQPSRCARWPITQSSPTVVSSCAGAVEHRAVLHRRARADHDAALVAPQHRLRPDRRLRGRSTTLPMIVASGCTNASGSICGIDVTQGVERPWTRRDRERRRPGDVTTRADVAASQRMHQARVAEDGYTIVEDAIEPELVDALHDDLLGSSGSSTSSRHANSFEGHHTLRIYNLLAFGALYERVPVHATCCRSSTACSTRAA